MENSGDIDNWGLEFALNTVNIKANDFSWETNFTIAFDRSEVLDLGGVDFQLFNAKGMKEDNLILKVGENVGNWFGYQQAVFMMKVILISQEMKTVTSHL